MYADALGFLAPQGEDPIASPELKLDLVHLTSAPPYASSCVEVLHAHDRFRNSIEKQSRFKIIERRGDLAGLGNGVTGVVFGLQHAPFDVLDYPHNLHELYDAGIRIMGIVRIRIHSVRGFWIHSAVSRMKGWHCLRNCMIITSSSILRTQATKPLLTP